MCARGNVGSHVQARHIIIILDDQDATADVKQVDFRQHPAKLKGLLTCSFTLRHAPVLAKRVVLHRIRYCDNDKRVRSFQLTSNHTYLTEPVS